MRLIIKGRNIELTPALKQYATEKFSKISKIFDQIIELSAILSVEKNPSITNNQIAEVIVSLKGGRIQAKEESENMYACIDLLVDKIERQIIKHKSKLGNKSKARSGAASIREISLNEPADADGSLNDLDEDIVKIDLRQDEVEV